MLEKLGSSSLWLWIHSSKVRHFLLHVVRQRMMLRIWLLKHSSCDDVRGKEVMQYEQMWFVCILCNVLQRPDSRYVSALPFISLVRSCCWYFALAVVTRMSCVVLVNCCMCEMCWFRCHVKLWRDVLLRGGCVVCLCFPRGFVLSPNLSISNYKNILLDIFRGIVGDLRIRTHNILKHSLKQIQESQTDYKSIKENYLLGKEKLINKSSLHCSTL